MIKREKVLKRDYIEVYTTYVKTYSKIIEEIKDLKSMIKIHSSRIRKLKKTEGNEYQISAEQRWLNHYQRYLESDLTLNDIVYHHQPGDELPF